MNRLALVFAVLVTWEASWWVTDPCPDSPISDPYNPQDSFIGSGFSCLVNHGHYEYRDMSTVFETEKEAQKFIENDPNGYEFTVREIKEIP